MVGPFVRTTEAGRREAMSAHALVAYVATNAVIALVSACLIEPVRLAFKEMGKRQTLIWLACVPIAAAFYWLLS